MTKITEQKIIKPFLASKITDYSKLKYPLWKMFKEGKLLGETPSHYQFCFDY